MRINGWYRLWIVASLLIAAYCGFVVYQQYAFSSDETVDMDLIRTMAVIWAVASVAVLIVGHSIAWAIKGFRTTKEKEGVIR